MTSGILKFDLPQTNDEVSQYQKAAFYFTLFKTAEKVLYTKPDEKNVIANVSTV
jgi:hypothetical protein